MARLHGICDSVKLNSSGASWREPGQEQAHRVACSGNLCADWDWPTALEVRDSLRVVRVGGTLKIDTAFVEEE